MKVSIARKIVLFASGMLLVFLCSMLIVTYNMNNKAAKDNAEKLVTVFEGQMIDGGYKTKAQFETLVHVSDIQKIRISIIDIDDGLIIADSAGELLSNENHLSRPEIKEALQGVVGYDIRKSETTGIKYLYTAKVVEVENTAVILRVCVPINSINAYVYGILITMIVVFLIIVIIALILSRFMAKSFLLPFNLIKNRLDNVIEQNTQNTSIALTNYDDINTILMEIDSISLKLNAALVDYQSEKNKLDIIIENINQGIIAIDKENNIISCNKTAENYFNFEYYGGMKVQKAIRNKTLLDNIERSISKKEYICYDHTRVNGEIFEVRFYPAQYAQISLIISAQNVTQIRRVSIEKQEFFENAGHELKTPLSSILGYSEMLKKEGKFNQMFVEKINKEAYRMKLLIDDMLKISQLEQKIQLKDEQIELSELTKQVVLSYLPKVESKKITLVSNLECCTILANREKIIEVVANLIDNAIKYTNEGGQIQVCLKNENGKIVFSVQDNGIGIPKQYLSRIFERFFRANKSETIKESGTGLGLAIVKYICNYYNAPIFVESEKSKGAKFVIIFNQAKEK